MLDFLLHPLILNSELFSQRSDFSIHLLFVGFDFNLKSSQHFLFRYPIVDLNDLLEEIFPEEIFNAFPNDPRVGFNQAELSNKILRSGLFHFENEVRVSVIIKFKLGRYGLKVLMQVCQMVVV